MTGVAAEQITRGRPCIDVIIAAYAAEETIARAVKSALQETETAAVMVVEDGSIDDTAGAALACDDGTGRLTVLRQENRGPSSARNTGVAHTTSPAWCVLDADDAFVPGRFGRLLQAVGDDWDMAADGTRFVEPDGREQVLAVAPGVHDLSFEAFVRSNVPRRNAHRQELGFLQPLKRRAFFAAHELCFRPGLRFAEDYVLYAEALAHGARFRCASTPGYIAHVTAASLSQHHTPADFERLIEADRDMLALPNLGSGDRKALARHIHLQRLKAQYLKVDAALAAGRPLLALGHGLRDHHTAGFMFNHRYRGPLSRWVKGLLGRPKPDLHR